MNLVIIGGGQLGQQIATTFHRTHSVTVVDQREYHAQAFDTLDVRFVRGNGADPSDLEEAGTGAADAFIACTSNDDVNVLACLAAKGLGARETMAFVSRQRYLDAFARRGAMASIGLSIDRVLWPQRTLADQIVDIVRVPRALDSASFADGRVQLLEYRLEEGDPFLDRTLAEAGVPPSALVVGSIREESFVIPSGRTVLRRGDKVVFMGTAESMRAVERRFAPRRRHLHVTIIGGGNVGFMVAERLQDAHAQIKVVELDEARGDKLAQLLPRTLVLHGDGTDLELMEQERLHDSDVVVAVTDDDGKNLLVSLLAKQLGVPKVVTRVGRARNRRLFERVGIDSPLTPRTAALQEVLNWLRLDQVDHLATIEDRAEVMEVVYPRQGAVGRVADLGAPPDSLIGAIVRKDRVLVPSGETTIQHGDRLYIVTTPDNVAAVERWLERQRRSEG